MKQELYRYIASFDDIIDSYDGNLYRVQESYGSGSGVKLTFHPLAFLASNIQLFGTKKKTITYEYKDRMYQILTKGKCTQKCEDDITCLYIEMKKQKEQLKKDYFDRDAYASMYYYYIKEYYGRDFKKEEHEVERFYVEYGFRNDLLPEPIDGFIYLASIASTCNEDELRMSEKEAIVHHFQNKTKPLLFNPYLYLASNWVHLSKFANACIEERQLAKHYITTGLRKQYKIHSFDHYSFLANNTSYIEELMYNINGRKTYDIVKINPIDTAKLFVKYRGICKTDSFDPVSFVKLYIDDEYVNFDKKLSVDNAARYFVRSYVHSSIVRWRTTYRYKVLQFLRNRIYDGIRQTPFHLIRAICCK